MYVDVSYTNVFYQVRSVMKTLQLKYYLPCKTNLFSQILQFFLEDLGIKNLCPEVENNSHVEYLVLCQWLTQIMAIIIIIWVIINWTYGSHKVISTNNY